MSEPLDLRAVEARLAARQREHGLYDEADDDVIALLTALRIIGAARMSSPRSPDAIEAVSIEPLTEYEATQASAVFHELLKREDPYALTHTIEHILKMRALVDGGPPSEGLQT